MEMEHPVTNQVSTKDWHWQDLLVLTLVLLTCLPALVFRYLPMADLPQHMAIAAVLANPTDTGLGYDEHYAVNYGSTLYLLPYLWTVGFRNSWVWSWRCGVSFYRWRSFQSVSGPF